MKKLNISRNLFISVILSALTIGSVVLLGKFRTSEIASYEANSSIERIAYSDISEAKVIRQSFTSEADSISRLELFVGNYKRKKSEPASFKLYKELFLSFFRRQEKVGVSLKIYDKNAVVLVQQDLDLSKVKNVEHVSVNFNPIQNSKNGQFILELKPLNERTFQILTFNTATSSSPACRLDIDGKELSGRQLMFAAFLSETTITTDTLMERISQNKPGYLKKKSLYTVVFLFISAIIFLILYLLPMIFSSKKRR